MGSVPVLFLYTKCYHYLIFRKIETVANYLPTKTTNAINGVTF